MDTFGIVRRVEERLQRQFEKACDRFWWSVLQSLSAWWDAAYWYCAGCGRPQAGESPWPGIKRCRACGPGEGWVACPAAHESKKPCPLCKGQGFVEELT